jgi:hypothetical protein
MWLFDFVLLEASIATASNRFVHVEVFSMEGRSRDAAL